MRPAKDKSALWSADAVAAATGGRCSGDWTASGVSIDTRTLRPGDLFIAIRGERLDGHRYLAAALDAGAAGAVVDTIPDGMADDDPRLVVVGDTMQALQALGRAGRERSAATIVAVTGSVGKTSIKEALRLVLSAQGATSASIGNLNNHWGAPLSLARLPADSRFGVLEVGMNHTGELAALGTIVRPHVAVISNIEPVHIENFDSVEGIAEAKAELLASVAPGGAAVLPRDSAHYELLRRRAKAAGIERILDFGSHAAAYARVTDYGLNETSSRVSAVIGQRVVNYRVGAPGQHWILNSLAALAAVDAAGGNVGEAALALGDLTAMGGRGKRHVVHLGSTEALLVIDDSYNASPPSMAAAFQLLADTNFGDGARRVAVLGDMLELGRASPHLHADLADNLIRAGIHKVHTCGQGMTHLRNRLPLAMRGVHSPDARTLAPMVAAWVRSGDIVLVKGSRGMRTDIVVDALLGLDRAPAAVSE